MSSNESPKVVLIEETVDILNQTIQKLQENDHVSAHVMLGVVRQLLGELQGDLEQHLLLEKKLKRMLECR